MGYPHFFCQRPMANIHLQEDQPFSMSGSGIKQPVHARWKLIQLDVQGECTFCYGQSLHPGSGLERKQVQLPGLRYPVVDANHKLPAANIGQQTETFCSSHTPNDLHGRGFKVLAGAVVVILGEPVVVATGRGIAVYKPVAPDFPAASGSFYLTNAPEGTSFRPMFDIKPFTVVFYQGLPTDIYPLRTFCAG